MRDIIEVLNQGVYEYKNVKYDASKRNPIGQIRQDFFSVEEVLPNKKNKILISIQEGVPDGMQAVARAIRPRSYWEYDLKKNRRKLIIRGKISLGNIRFDSDGNPTHATGYDRRTNEYTYHWRPKGTT